MSYERTTAPGEIDLQTLRDGYAALACEPDPERETPGDHPEPDTIYAAVHGELTPSELREVVKHTAACPLCAEEWRLAMAFAEEAEEDEEPLRRPATISRPALRLVPIAAAFVVAVLAAGVWLTVGQSPEQTAPVLRDDTAGYALVSVAPESEPLDRSDPVLRWRFDGREAPEGTTYDVLIFAGDYETEVTDLQVPRFTLPPEALEGLPPGTEIEWLVTATTPDGRRTDSFSFLTPIR